MFWLRLLDLCKHSKHDFRKVNDIFVRAQLMLKSRILIGWSCHVEFAILFYCNVFLFVFRFGHNIVKLLSQGTVWPTLTSKSVCWFLTQNRLAFMWTLASLLQVAVLFLNFRLLSIAVWVQFQHCFKYLLTNLPSNLVNRCVVLI